MTGDGRQAGNRRIFNRTMTVAAVAGLEVDPMGDKAEAWSCKIDPASDREGVWIVRLKRLVDVETLRETGIPAPEEPFEFASPTKLRKDRVGPRWAALFTAAEAALAEHGWHVLEDRPVGSRRLNNWYRRPGEPVQIRNVVVRAPATESGGGGPSKADSASPCPEIAAVLARHAPAGDPTDQCLETAEAVTADLRAIGRDARSATVFGWMDPQACILLFAHRATLVDGLVLDATARQFHPDLPDQWIATVAEYSIQLAEATGVREVTVQADQ